jgi:drug/metabolite transporter (DMT)-like permease
MASSEASVLLATEPIWAAAFAAALLGEAVGANDVAGGALIVLGCVCNAVEPQRIRDLIGIESSNNGRESVAVSAKSNE